MLSRALLVVAASSLLACTEGTSFAVDEEGSSHAALTVTSAPVNGCRTVASGHDTGAGAGVANDGFLHPDEIESTQQVCEDGAPSDAIYAVRQACTGCPGGPPPSAVYDASGAYIGELLEMHKPSRTTWDDDFYAPTANPHLSSAADVPGWLPTIMTIVSPNGFVYRLDTTGGAGGAFYAYDPTCSVRVAIRTDWASDANAIVFAILPDTTTYFVPDAEVRGLLRGAPPRGVAVKSYDGTSCIAAGDTSTISVGRIYRAAQLGLPAHITPPFLFGPPEPLPSPR